MTANATQPALPFDDAGDGDLMTTFHVAMKFRTTSVQVVAWTKRADPPLNPIYIEGGHRRFRRSEVEALFEGGFRGEPSAMWREDQARAAMRQVRGDVES